MGEAFASDSVRAAATFASVTGSGVSAAGRMSRTPSAPAVIALVSASLVVGIIAGTLVLRRVPRGSTTGVDPGEPPTAE